MTESLNERKIELERKRERGGERERYGESEPGRLLSMTQIRHDRITALRQNVNNHGLKISKGFV